MDGGELEALLDEGLKKSAVLWLQALPDGRAQPLWHVYDGTAVHLLTGGLEQPAPGGLADGGTARLVLRSKATRARVLVVDGAVSVVAPQSAEWEAVVPLLTAKRLNLPDGERAPQRWAAQCTVWRIELRGPVQESAADPSLRSHAGPPPPTPATTRVPRPWHLFGRRRRRTPPLAR